VVTGSRLVVDDHKPNRIKISFAVKQLGHIAEVAEDGPKPGFMTPGARFRDSFHHFLLP
jgi:CheY-like chemotaxis protein